MRPLKNLCEIAVIGGGLAGLTAARHAARLGRLVTLFEGGALFGGSVATVGEVDGLPVPGKFSGQDLAMHLLADIRKAAVQIVECGITKLDLNKRLALTDQQQKTWHPEAIIVASGTAPRKLQVPGEDEFSGRGVSRCATCDGGFFRGQDVVVVGGGDAALQEALTLAKTCRRVIMVCRSPLKAQRHYIDKLSALENLSFIWESEISAIIGKDGVTGVRIRNMRNHSSSEIECAGVFPFIGGVPDTAFVPPALLTATGHIKTNPDLTTNDARVFAVGAVRANYGGQVLQAMTEGISAAEAAARLRA
jgi:thioredoxin reductase (NADPH)